MIALILLVAAFVCAALAAAGVGGRVNLLALSFALWLAMQLMGRA